MKCNICGEREATVHLTEVINDNVTKLHLCEVCAQEKSQEMQSHFGLSDLLSGLMDFDASMADENGEVGTSIKCSTCGMTYFDFQKTGRLGCGKCYDDFSDKLSELLKKIHGADRHIGKMPFGNEERVNAEESLESMREQLNELVKSEEFEKAALVVDRIRDVEKKIKK